MAARELTRKDLAEAAEKYQNWGRWGQNDGIGTLNHVSPEDIVASAKLVRKGYTRELLAAVPGRDRLGHAGVRGTSA